LSSDQVGTGLDLSYSDLPSESRLFAERAARSIAEIQDKVSSVADIVIFLEVLGYNESMVTRYGFSDLLDLARYIFNFVDFYSKESGPATQTTQPTKIKSLSLRIFEGLALAFPIVGMLAVLMITGVSLWMTRVLPLPITTAFLAGVFLGILISEGSLQSFNRIFMFYWGQGNLAESKRVLARNYYFLIAELSVSVFILFLVGFVANIPLYLIFIAAFSTVTIASHRSSYMLIFSMKKLGHLVAAYAAALVALVGVYFLSAPFFSDVLTRYLLSLVAAFTVLSVPAIYFHSKVMSSKATRAKNAPHFYRPQTITEGTISSRFGIQLWETLAYFLFGTFFFLMIFSDRILSWIFNPAVSVYGSGLPFVFNAAYHDGADPALVILLVTTVISYVLVSPVYDRLANLNSKLKVHEARAVEDFFRNTYGELLLAAILASTVTAFVLNYEGSEIMFYLRAGAVSLGILRIASIADIFLAIFFVNAMFLSLVNKMKLVAVTSVACVMIILTVGTLFGLAGFQYIIWGYLFSSFVAMIASTAYCMGLMGKFSVYFFGKYV
jgi:hypothetical protein